MSFNDSYLDYAASAPIKPEVLAAVTETLALTGNASSVHGFGRAQRERVESARKHVADHFAVKAASVVFTAGATEANNTILKGVDAASIIISAIEHSSILGTVPDAVRLRVSSDGVIDLNHLEELLKVLPQPALVAVMLVNNETGVIQPVRAAVELAQQYGAHLHCDAVQAVGKLRFTFADLGADSISLSAHKIGGPQGVGALVLGPCTAFKPLLDGGGQEMRRRASTENVAGIVGFGEAIRLAAQDVARQDEWRAWRDALEAKLAAQGAILVGNHAPRVATLSCVAMPGVPAETQLMVFDLAGIAVSSGSACSSGKVKASHVLSAMGLGDTVATSALRFSFGWQSSAQALEKCAKVWSDLRHARPNS